MPRTKQASSRVIALLSQKGGVGKTTLAGLMAEWFQQRNLAFRLLDGNPGQQSLTRWAELRASHAVKPPMEVLPSFEVTWTDAEPQLVNKTAELLQAPFSGTTILDLAGEIDRKLVPALRHSDTVVLPVPTKCFEYLSLTEVFALFDAASQVRQEDGRRPLEVYLVLNCVRRTNSQDSARRGIVAASKLRGVRICKSELGEYDDFHAAQMGGRSALSFAPSGKAAKQFDALARELELGR